MDPSRREFLKNSALAASGFFIIPRHVLGRGFVAPSDKLNIASIGAGGKGADDINHFDKSGKANIAYLCDVDDRQSAGSRKKFPSAKYYKDYRELLSKEAKSIDAVSVSTPDHMHAVAAMAAMQLGKHVYVQKPLTHDIYEARMLTEAAKRYKVVTQMGNQGSSGDGVRQLVDWYKAGLIGDVHSVYCFTNRPIWPQGIARPATASAIPPELDYNLWLGTAPFKDYFEKLSCLLTGGGGGTMVRAPWAIWPATSWHRRSRCWDSVIPFLQNAVWLPVILKTGKWVIFPRAA